MENETESGIIRGSVGISVGFTCMPKSTYGNYSKAVGS